MLQRKTGYRWMVVSLLFFATTINYIDRQIISLLKDTLSKEFNWNEKDYGHLVAAFNAAYALGNVVFGIFIDRIGSKLGYTISIIFWSIAASLTGFVKSTAGFFGVRIILGLGESGNFPTAIRSVAEWFPKRERAFATGIFNAGTNIAAVIGPPIIAGITAGYGWRAAFITTGILGFIWLIFWLIFYETPYKKKGVNQAEIDYIHSDVPDGANPDSQKINWFKMFGMRRTWAFVFGKFFTDPVWWFYLFWVPSYFNNTYHINLQVSWVYVSTLYLIVTVGSVVGGYLPGWLISKGWTVRRARRVSMFIYAVCVTPVFFVQYTHSAWPAVWLISLAAGAHQAWSANIFTSASDVFPKASVSSIIGLGTMAGAVGSIIFPLFIGSILDHYKALNNVTAGYNIIFAICSCAYIVAWVVMQFFSRTRKAE